MHACVDGWLDDGREGGSACVSITCVSFNGVHVYQLHVLALVVCLPL